jgi:hypothetical protein
MRLLRSTLDFTGRAPESSDGSVVHFIWWPLRDRDSRREQRKEAWPSLRYKALFAVCRALETHLGGVRRRRDTTRVALPVGVRPAARGAVGEELVGVGAAGGKCVSNMATRCGRETRHAPEQVALRLQQVGGQLLGAVAVEEGQRAGEGRRRDAPEDGLGNDAAPAGLRLVDGLVEEVVEAAGESISGGAGERRTREPRIAPVALRRSRCSLGTTACAPRPPLTAGSRAPGSCGRPW